MTDTKTEEPQDTPLVDRVRANSDACPYCGSDEVNADSLVGEGLEVWRAVTCDVCGARWGEHYRLDRVDAIGAPNLVPKNYAVTYLIRSSDHEFHSRSNTIEIKDQPSAAAAKRTAIAWIENNDPAHDDRIEPVIEILGVVQEEDGPDADAGDLV